MGKDTVRFSCHHCNHCCTEVVCLPTPWDVRRIHKMTGEDPEGFIEFLEPDEIEGVDEDDATWLEVGKKRYIMALERDEKLGCHFLDKKTRLCSIYAARPILCRLYPFKVIENKKGEYQGFTLHDDVGCPRHRDGEVATAPLYDLYVQDELNQDDYQQLVNVFNSMDYKGKEPHHFIEMFMEGWTDWMPPVPKEKKKKKKARR